MKPSTCFFTIVDDNYYYPVGTHKFVNSFKRFHPDIDLIVFRQDMIDKVFKEKGINFYMAKPTFAKLLTDQYDRVINIDADTVITGRLTEILDTEWDIGAVWNFNKYENSSVEEVTEEQYVQAGLVGSSCKEFWDIWEEYNKKAMDYRCKENDTLNLVWYRELLDKKKLIWDKDKNYLGCKSLGQEKDMYMEDGELKLNGEVVKAYHHARGGIMPKLDYNHMDFKLEVKEYLNWISMFGKTMRLSTI
jgi:hypothetical protein